VSVAAPRTLGTAGHIDHGKTALVRALTGRDTDRLPEERQRGISIELGYAPLHLPSGRRLSVVDVPGHERFVRTMVAGATGVDLFLMTVAADDGVMPQTKEHAAVLAGLGVTHGVVAVTKADRADPQRALSEAAELLPGVDAVALSAHTGSGLEELRSLLDDVAAGLPERVGGDDEARLHIDRVFSITGAGTVVTGTLWAGQIARGDELVLLPGGRRARVRGVQVHDRVVDRAAAGQRVAVNLGAVAVSELARGDVLAAVGGDLSPTHIIDVALELSGHTAAPRQGERVAVHHGTRESSARHAWLGGQFWQLRLERPLMARDGDRLVIRRLAPPDTLGGGVVLDAHARRHGAGPEALARLERRRRGQPEPAEATDLAPTPEAAALPQLGPEALRLEQRLREANFEPPGHSELSPAEAALLPALRASGRAVRVGRTLHYHPEALAAVQRVVVELIGREGSVTLAALRDELHTSRKFAQALLEHMDSARVTRRLPDDRRLLRRTPSH